eukprot:GHVR01060583.1.p1 GENE.GHVR01060583.1~~GHVR01060583.1.p1  ORF type:complete len:489 (+),score=83.05 GHVR01060583.1:55-1467(+)
MPRKTLLARRLHRLLIFFESIVELSTLILLMASFLEPPLWCVYGHDPKARIGSCINSSAKDSDHPMMGLPLLEPKEFFLLEAPIVILLASHLILEFIAYGCAEVLRTPSSVLKTILTLLYSCDFIYAYADPRIQFRLAPFIRVAMVANFNRGVRREFRLFGRLLPQLVSFVVSILIHVGLFSWVGTLIFQRVDPVNFGTLVKSSWSLLVLLTTCNYPDVALPSFYSNRFSIIFFVVYVAIGCFFLLNFVVAVVLSAYQTLDEQEEKESLDLTELHLKYAFDIVDFQKKNYISREEFRCLVDEMRRYHKLSGRAQSWTADQIHIAFAVLDSEGDSKLSLDNFFQLTVLMQVSFERIIEDTFLERQCPCLAESTCFLKLKEIVLSTTFEVFMFLLLLVMAVFTVAESVVQLTTGEQSADRFDEKPDSIWNFLELFFCVVFVLEALLKIISLGWTTYTGELINFVLVCVCCQW